MNAAQQKKFDFLYRQHLSALRRQGKAASTIDVYARAVRRLTTYWNRCPDTLTVKQLETYFHDLVQSHSWSTVKVDRNGLQFFYRHVLKRDWDWVAIVKPPRTSTLPDLLTRTEIETLINGTRELRYQTFILAAYSMGLRLSEVLSLQVKAILRSCGIHKDATPHTLRHSYGAHLVEAGLNLRTIQHQMGHESPKTTALYTQLTEHAQADAAARINTLVAGLTICWGT